MSNITIWWIHQPPMQGEDMKGPVCCGVNAMTFELSCEAPALPLAPSCSLVFHVIKFKLDPGPDHLQVTAGPHRTPTPHAHTAQREHWSVGSLPHTTFKYLLRSSEKQLTFHKIISSIFFEVYAKIIFFSVFCWTELYSLKFELRHNFPWYLIKIWLTL